MSNWYPTGTLEAPFNPVEVSDVEVAFPAYVAHLLPPEDAIPDDFKWNRNPDHTWRKFQQKWFFEGIDLSKVVVREGFDTNTVLRHLMAIQGSFEPKHEYKEAAVAFLASLWLESWQ